MRAMSNTFGLKLAIKFDDVRFLRPGVVLGQVQTRFDGPLF